MTETKITTKSGNEYTFFGIDNDFNGNPRYVVHYTDLLSDLERDALSILDGFALAQRRGYFKYKGKQIGGGVGIDGMQCYSLHYAAELLDAKKNKVLRLSKSGNLDRLCDEIYGYICNYLEEDRDYIKTLIEIKNYPRTKYDGKEYYDAGLRYVTCGEFLCNIEMERNLLIECGYKAQNWTCDRILLKLAEAANMVLAYVCLHFKF